MGKRKHNHGFLICAIIHIGQVGFVGEFVSRAGQSPVLSDTL